MDQIKRYRTIWISDIHLGTRGCQAKVLLDFLRKTDSDYLFLVGDIIDFWSLRRQIYWPESHNTIVQKILRKARHGTQVIYIPGNHDEVLRQFVGNDTGGVKLEQQHVHVLADGRKILCIHGDEFDVVTRYHKWIAVLGDTGYSFLLWLNRHFNYFRSLLGMRFWSLSAYIKYKVKTAVSFISDFEDNVIKSAKDHDYDGVLCGHIHHAEIKPVGEWLYLNDGDWVESCTAIVENFDGSLELIRWLEYENNTNSK